MELAVEVSEYAGIPVLAFTGDLDGILIDEFERAVIEAAQDAQDCVIVDLGGVTYIDSQAFGRLLKAHVVLENSGGDIAIVSNGKDTSRIIETFGVDYLLGVFEGVNSAAAYLRPLVRAHEQA